MSVNRRAIVIALGGNITERAAGLCDRTSHDVNALAAARPDRSRDTMSHAGPAGDEVDRRLGRAPAQWSLLDVWSGHTGPYGWFDRHERARAAADRQQSVHGEAQLVSVAGGEEMRSRLVTQRVAPAVAARYRACARQASAQVAMALPRWQWPYQGGRYGR
jgi:hypothetical protein